MKVTYYGHACFSVELGGKHLLFDPYISSNPFARAIDIKKIPADFILITHGHDDHMEDALAIAQRTKAPIISNYEVAEWFAKKGAPATHGLNPGGGFNFPFGRASAAIAIHSSSFPDGQYAGIPIGFVIESREGNFYYSGDTALTCDMKLIPETTPLKWAALCIGDNFTMGPAAAARAAEFIQCREILGVHYDTFPHIKIDHSQAMEEFTTSGRNLHLMKIGETRDF